MELSRPEMQVFNQSSRKRSSSHSDESCWSSWSSHQWRRRSLRKKERRCAGYRLQCREKRSGLKQQLRNWRTPARYVRKRTVARLRLLFSFFYISLLARSRPSSSCSWILENGGWRWKARLREWQRWENKWVDGNDSFCCCHVKLGRESLREKI